MHASKAAFLLLHNAASWFGELTTHGSRVSGNHVATAAAAALTSTSLATAAAKAARGAVATAVQLRSEVAARQRQQQQQQLSPGPLEQDMTRLCAECQGMAAQAGRAVGVYAMVLAQILFYRVMGARGGLEAALGSMPFQSAATMHIPAEAVELVQAWEDSELLAAAAVAVLDSPPVYDSDLLFSEQERDRLCAAVQDASFETTRAMFYLREVVQVAQAAGPDGRRLAARVTAMTRHVAVRRLQVRRRSDRIKLSKSTDSVLLQMSCIGTVISELPYCIFCGMVSCVAAGGAAGPAGGTRGAACEAAGSCRRGGGQRRAERRKSCSGGAGTRAGRRLGGQQWHVVACGGAGAAGAAAGTGHRLEGREAVWLHTQGMWHDGWVVGGPPLGHCGRVSGRMGWRAGAGAAGRGA